MEDRVILAQGTHGTGARTLTPEAIPERITKAQVRLDGTNMTNSSQFVIVTMDLSLDGGVTWASTNRGRNTDPFPVACEFRSGALRRDGLPLDTYLVGCDIPDLLNPNRQIRVSINIRGLDLTTTGVLRLI